MPTHAELSMSNGARLAAVPTGLRAALFETRVRRTSLLSLT